MKAMHFLEKSLKALCFKDQSYLHRGRVTWRTHEGFPGVMMGAGISERESDHIMTVSV